MKTARRGLVAVVTALVAWLPADATAQAIRGSAVSAIHMVELRPLRADTIAPEELVTGPDGELLLDGIAVPCRPSRPCILFRPDARTQAVSFTQDVRVTAWGFGVAGLSTTAFLRARSDLGSDFTWPRADDAFDAIIAYVEYDTEPFRFRLGRQVTAGGLGFSSYDGGSVLYRRGRGISAEVYGGRSLARGLSEPRSEALRGFETFAPDPTVVLLGAALAANPIRGLDLSARYQREIFADRSALASERASLEAVYTNAGPIRLSGTLDYDFARGIVGKSDLRLQATLPRSLALEAIGRRYVPYFELWTIWGFFDPVAWHEAELLLAWAASPSLRLRAGAALRRYSETGAGILGPEIERNTRQLRLAGWWRPADRWSVDGAWRYETGFGATIGRADLAARYAAGDRLSVHAFFTAFEQAEEFRVGVGRVIGAGLGGRIRAGARTAVEGGVSLYDHGSTRADTPDWTQRRVWAGLQIDLGSDPGLRGGSPR